MPVALYSELRCHHQPSGCYATIGVIRPIVGVAEPDCLSTAAGYRSASEIVGALFRSALPSMERLHGRDHHGAGVAPNRPTARAATTRVRCTAPALRAHCRCRECARAKTPLKSHGMAFQRGFHGRYWTMRKPRKPAVSGSQPAVRIGERHGIFDAKSDFGMKELKPLAPWECHGAHGVDQVAMEV